MRIVPILVAHPDHVCDRGDDDGGVGASVCHDPWRRNQRRPCLSRVHLQPAYASSRCLPFQFSQPLSGPIVYSVTPTDGPTTGGITATITGANFGTVASGPDVQITFTCMLTDSQVLVLTKTTRRRTRESLHVDRMEPGNANDPVHGAQHHPRDISGTRLCRGNISSRRLVQYGCYFYVPHR